MRQFDFPLFQTLLLGREVINIRVRKIIRFAKFGIAIFLYDDSLGQMVQLRYRIAEKTRVHHMVIVISVVKSDQTIPNEAFDVLSRRVDHTNDRVLFRQASSSQGRGSEIPRSQRTRSEPHH